MIGAREPAGAGAVHLDECAAVGRRDVAGWCCGGVLVHPRVVLTTAHSGPAGGFAVPRAVVLRAADLSDTAGAEIIEGKFVAHEAYTGRGAFDIAAMLLERDSAVPPVTLANTAEMSHATEVMLAGFGADHEARGLVLSVRRAVTVPIRFFSAGPPGPLPDMAASIRFNPDLEFLAGAHDSGPCFGDSGGPAYIFVGARRKLVGIISRPAARRKPFCKGLTILTRIDAFQSWIQCRISSAGVTAQAGS